MLNLHDHGATTPLALKRTYAKGAGSRHRGMNAKTDTLDEGGNPREIKKEPPTCAGGSWSFMAPRVGFEPTTLRLTAGCSAVELPRNFFGALRFLGARKYYRHFNFRRNPLFSKIFSAADSRGLVDSQPHPNTSISLSNSTGHVWLSLGECLSGGEGAGPSGRARA